MPVVFRGPNSNPRVYDRLEALLTLPDLRRKAELNALITDLMIRKAPRDLAPHPHVSVLIPARNEESNIRACLERGMIDLASDLFKLIDPARASEPQVLAVGLELEKARREIARKN